MEPSLPITQDLLTVPRTLPSGPINLIGMSRSLMSERLLEIGTPEKQVRMRVTQIWQWIYQKGIRNFNDMTNLSKSYRDLLIDNFVIEVPQVVSKQCSKDGTRKYLLRLAGGHEVEAVYIPEEGRGTLCISSQVMVNISYLIFNAVKNIVWLYLFHKALIYGMSYFLTNYSLIVCAFPIWN